MSSVTTTLFIALSNVIYALEQLPFPVDEGPPIRTKPFPFPDPTNYTLTFVTDYDNQPAAALGSTPAYWDGQIRTANGVNIVSTVKSWNLLPAALPIAVYTVKHMTDSIQKSAVLNQLQNHNVYIYHCDPGMKTGIGLQAKQGQYDYVSDLLNYDQNTHDGRAVDQVYGYGGTPSGPTSTCDCNVLGRQCSSNAYMSSSILVHEFGHTIMDIGIRYGDPTLFSSLTGSIWQAYRRVSGAASSYCGSTPNEMWACGVQTWLSGTSRTDVNPGISTVNDIYNNVRDLYNALYQTFGQPPTHLIPSLPNVNGVSCTAHSYYDWYINTYRYDSVKTKWNSVKGIGSCSGDDSGPNPVPTPRPNPAPTPRPTPSTTAASSGGFVCGQTVSGSIAAGGTAYHSFLYQGGDILMYGCGRTYFSNKLKIIDYYWNEKGSDSANYYPNSCNTNYQDQTVWADKSYFSHGARYWLVIQGATPSDAGQYSITMYCYGAGENTVELDDSDAVRRAVTSPWSILVITVLCILVINAGVIFCIVRYFKNKMKEYQNNESGMVKSQKMNKMVVLAEKDISDDEDEDEIEVDIEIEDGVSKPITTR